MEVKSDLEEVRLQVACATRKITLDAAHVRVLLTSANVVTAVTLKSVAGGVVAGGKVVATCCVTTEDGAVVPKEVVEGGVKLLLEGPNGRCQEAGDLEFAFDAAYDVDSSPGSGMFTVTCGEAVTRAGSYSVALEYTEGRAEVVEVLQIGQVSCKSELHDVIVHAGPPSRGKWRCTEGRVQRMLASDGPEQASRLLLTTGSLQVVDEYENPAHVGGISYRVRLTPPLYTNPTSPAFCPCLAATGQLEGVTD